METPHPGGQDLISPEKPVFDPQTGFLVLQLSKTDYQFFDRPVQYMDHTFRPKSELHITILSARAAEDVREYIRSSPGARASINEVIIETNWRFRKLDDFFLVQESPGVETIIQMVELPSLFTFLSSISGLIGKGILIPPAHVTLYTRGTEEGIGLPSEEVFNRLVQKAIDPAKLRLLPVDYDQGTI